MKDELEEATLRGFFCLCARQSALTWWCKSTTGLTGGTVSRRQGIRELGIPTVLDRLIQQALNQVMTPIFDPNFSNRSYGFRPGRNAHQAVLQARAEVSSGKRWVADIDLESPLSPLLSNILLDDLDKELEKRGYSFCRYADDCNIYVRSEKAGERVLGSVRAFLEKKLKLQVNQHKSAVARPWHRKFLGYSMTWHQQARLKVAPKSVQRLKETLREGFRRARGRNLGRFIQELKPTLRGWINYFRLSETKGVLEELDGRGPWWNSGASHMNLAFPKNYFDKLGLMSLLEELQRLQKTSRTAVYGTVRAVV